MRKDFWYVLVLHFLIMYLLTLLVEDLVRLPCLRTSGRTKDDKTVETSTRVVSESGSSNKKGYGIRKRKFKNKKHTERKPAKTLEL